MLAKWVLNKLSFLKTYFDGISKLKPTLSKELCLERTKNENDFDDDGSLWSFLPNGV